MTIEAQEADQALDVDLVFTKADLRDVVPHDNDPVVISVVTTGRKVHRILVDQGSSINVMFWSLSTSCSCLLLGRPTLNRLRAVASTRHVKLKLPDLEGTMIAIKSY